MLVDKRSFTECDCVENDSFYVLCGAYGEDSTRTLEELTRFFFSLHYSLGHLLG
jgi:hypothetical protein